MNRPALLATLSCGLALGIAGCGHEPAPDEAGEVLPKRAETGSVAGKLGPPPPRDIVVPSTLPILPVPKVGGGMDQPDATRPGGLPSEDSRKDGARPPEAAPGASPATPK